jgi:hypothetical protein
LHEKRGHKYQSDGNFDVPHRTRRFLFTSSCPLLRWRIGFNTACAKQQMILRCGRISGPLPPDEGNPGRVQPGGTAVCSTSPGNGWNCARMNRKRDAAGLARASAAADRPGLAGLPTRSAPGKAARHRRGASQCPRPVSLSRVMTEPDWTVQIRSHRALAAGPVRVC